MDATLPYLPSPLRAVVKLQSLTDARGGEILSMRPCDIDRTYEIWWYVPKSHKYVLKSHKTEHQGKELSIPLGRQAQEILEPFLDREPDAFLFSPAEAQSERAAELRAARRSREQPSQQMRAKGRTYWDRYDSASYRRAITRAVTQRNKDRQLHNIVTVHGSVQ